MSIIRPQQYYTAKLTRSLALGGSETEVYVDTLPTETTGSLVINPRSRTRREKISYTGTSSSPNRLTGVTRGLAFSTTTGSATTSTRSSSLCYRHTAGESVEMVAGHYESLVADIIGGVSPMANDLAMGSHKISGLSDGASAQDAVTLSQLQTTAIAGVSAATTTSMGGVEKSTTAELTAGTAAGSVAPLFASPDMLAAQIQSGSWLYALEDGTGSDDTYTWSHTPALTAYSTGYMACVKITVANTGAATGNANSLGAKSIKKYSAGAKTDIETGDLIAGMMAEFVYDGTDLILMNPGAGTPSASTMTSITSFFGGTGQGVATTFTAGEAVASGDVVCISAADTIKRVGATALTLGSSAGTVDSVSGAGEVFSSPFVTVSSGIGACLYTRTSTYVGINRCTFTPSTGAVIAPTTAQAFTLSSTKQAISMVPAGSGKCVAVVSANQINIRTFDLSSGITAGTEVVVDNTNTGEGYVGYISDSHVLCIYRDTSNAKIVFAKYTLSGTTLTLATTGEITTLTGVTFKIKGVVQMGEGSNKFAIFIQNTTAARGEVALATYDTSGSTFSIGSWTSMGRDIDNTDGYNVECVALSSSKMIAFFPNSGSNAWTSLLSLSGTTFTVSTGFQIANATPTYYAGLKYTLTKFNANTALLAYPPNLSNTYRIKFLEMDAAGTEVVTRLTSDAATGITVDTYMPSAAFRINAKTIGFHTITSGDEYSYPLAITQSEPIGVAAAAIALSATGSVTTSGYSSAVAGLTAASTYYAETGGVLGTDSNGSPRVVGIAKDATELIIGIR